MFNVHIYDPKVERRLARIECLLEILIYKGNKIIMNQQELAIQLAGVRDLLSEASTELVAKIAELVAAVEASGQVTPEVEAIAADLTAQAQGLAGIVPNPVVE